MADVSYTPTFHHVDWVDRVDRAEAGGPNGFNVRFNAIGADLRQFSTVVTQISAALGAPASNSGPTQTHLTFVPTLQGFDGFEGWSINDTGSMIASITFGVVANGLMNLAPPDQVRLQTMRVVGSLNPVEPGLGTLTVALFRTPLRLTNPPAAPELMASMESTFSGPIDEQRPIPPGVGQVDLNTFRYFVRAQWQNPDRTASATIEYVQLNFAA